MSSQPVTINLFDDNLSEDQALSQLIPVGFNDYHAAYRCLRRLAVNTEQRAALEQILPYLLARLREAAGPDKVLISLERFLGRIDDPMTVLSFMAGQPRGVEILVTLFAGSQFLTEILLRNPGYFTRLVEHKRLASPKSVEQLYNEAKTAIAPLETTSQKLDALRHFQSWELLRIGSCDLLGLYDLPAVTRQLSNLADSLIRSCLKIIASQLGTQPEQLTVLGMGKLGGRELNYSSDIDLLFLTDGDMETAQRLGERLIDALSHVSDEGFLYRVDMRLRPWGRVGPLVTSLDGHITYLVKHAKLWEKQALLKARPVAGAQIVGRTFLDRAWPLLFEMTYDELRSGVFAMKQRTESQLRLNGREWGEVKLGEGSIRDVEFTTQFLQLAYGARQPEILSPNTLDALARLSAFELINLDEHRVLSEGYIFLRTIEHHLQMLDYRQTHTLPQEADAITHLARRLGFGGNQPGEQFLARYQQHVIAIRSVYLHYIGSTEMKHSTDSQPPSGSSFTSPPQIEVHRHIDRMEPSYAEVFTAEEISRHAFLAGQLSADHQVEVDISAAGENTWRVTVVAFDFPGELSLICGLMFVHGLNIFSGDAFTYTPLSTSTGRNAPADTRRKIVDVFTVQPLVGKDFSPDLWSRYTEDLASVLQMLRAGQRAEAQGELAKRVATRAQDAELLSTGSFVRNLYPIEIQIDNEASDQYTVLRIDSEDTFGFLYEFTNALAINQIYIARMIVDSSGNRVHDILYVTDENGHKITETDRQRQLRAATVLIKHFTHLLPFSPNPESALLHFREFIGELFRRPNWPDELASLQRPEVLQGLARLLGVSDFLWDDFLRMQYVNLYPVVRDVDALTTAKSRKELEDELAADLRLIHDGPQQGPISENVPWIETLNAFKDREMFRIDMRHILGHTQEFWEFASELTDLAEVVINSAFHLLHEDLRFSYGTPRLEDGTTSQMSLLALGKFGGGELGFASDIELMFVYAGNGQTSGPHIISTAEFYEKLVQYFVTFIRARREGIFQVDLQLRPYGKAGSLAVSLDAFRRYFTPSGPAWAYERQALVKLRPVAGDPALGKQLSGLRDQYIYTGEPFNVTAMRAMRERQVRHLVTGGTFHPKYSLGGLIDIEYLVQGLQISYGQNVPSLRSTNTRATMAVLFEAGILSEEDYTRLRKAYTFFRWLIDSLRVVRGNAKDITVPPQDSEEFAFLARRMRYGNDTGRLRIEMTRYAEDVREINARLLR